VDKHIGDALMAVWGMGSTREDDPERAVRAGLAMQEMLSGLDVSAGLAMRVGINTGPAHLGSVGVGDEITAMGDTVNVASRVEGLAPIGGVLVTHDTYRHIRGIFDVEPRDPVRVKGKAEPLRTYAVQSAKERRFWMASRGVEGVETRMVGRQRELSELQREFERVVDGPEARFVTVVGDAGIGKSRLLYEFEDWIELHPATAYFFKGRATATRQAVTFGLLRDLLSDRFGIFDTDPTSAVAAKLHEGMAPGLASDEAEIVGHWLGFDLRSRPAVRQLLGSGQLATAARAHFFQYLASLTADEPAVVFLEDLHWADEESIDLVVELLRQCASAHLLVVGVGRPELLDRPEARPLLDASSLALTLRPLDADGVRVLVDEILQRTDGVPDELTDLIVERADGNAFYIEELIKMLIDEGVIEAGDAWEAWPVHLDKLRPEQVPSTLTGVLQSRLDGLTVDDRATLQQASVIGRTFWDGAVDALGRNDLVATARSLEASRLRELILRHGESSFEGSAEFAFKHALLRDVTYETVLLRERRHLHGLAAQWMSLHTGPRASELAGQIATHLRHAGEIGAAAELLHTDGVRSLEIGRLLAARRSLEEAVELWRSIDHEPPVAVLNELTDACARLGDLYDAEQWNAEALGRAVTPEEQANAQYLGSWIASERGDRRREEALLAAARPDAERIGGALYVRVLLGLGWLANIRGDLDEARSIAAEAVRLSEGLDHSATTRNLHLLLSTIAQTSGDLRAALDHVSDALTLALATGDLDGQAIALGGAGVCHHLMADASGSIDEYRAAMEHYRRAQSLYRRVGRHLLSANNTANMAQIAIRLGDDPAARRLLHEAITTLGDIGGSTAMLFCVLCEGDRRLTAGEEEGGLGLISVVHSHPAATQDNANEIGRILGRVGLTTDVLVRTAGTDEELATVVDQVLRELDAEQEA
ncbi:MAG TPA: AAA family ATPase, partial [Acidimicrobiales bacterium]